MDACLTDHDVQCFLAGGLSPEERELVARHVAVCRACADLLTSTISLQPASKTPPLALVSSDFSVNRSRESSAPIGISVEGYRIDREVARGGMGIVYEAIQLKLNRKVALKILPSTGADENIVKRFRHEATSAAKLHHTHIVPIYDFGQSGHIYYYAMELVEGWSLNELIRRLAASSAHTADHTRLVEIIRGQSPPHSDPSTGSSADSSLSSSGLGSGSASRGRLYYRHVAQWIADAADALHYAHAQGIIHRDIKPANLMLAVDGRIMILDFGLAKSVNDLSVTTTGALVGTLRYMSPEQAMAKRMKVDHRTDIYSLGATMYELLAFQPAFKGADEKETLGLIITRDPTPPRKILPEVPRELETICLKTLEKDPSSRYAAAKDLADDLRRYIQGLPIMAKPTGPVGRAVKFVRRRRALSIAAISILLMAITATVATRSILHARQKDREFRQSTIAAKLKEAIGHFQSNDFARAEQCYQEILEIDPYNTDAMISWVSAKRYRYDDSPPRVELEKCDELLDRAVRLSPKRADVWNARGVIHRIRGRHSDAIDAFKNAIAINSSFYATWVSLAIAHALNHDLPEAEKCLRQAVTLPQKSPDIMPWYNLAAVQHQLRVPSALDTIEKSLEIKTATFVPCSLRREFSLTNQQRRSESAA